MKLNVITGDFLKLKTDLLGFFVFEDQKLPESVNLVDKHLGKIISQNFKKEFSGKEKSFWVVNTLKKLPAERIVLLGCGKKDKFNPDKIRLAGATLIKAGLSVGAKNIAFEVPFWPKTEEKISERISGQFLAEGMILALYNFEGYKTIEKDEQKKVSIVNFLVSQKGKVKEFQKGLVTGKIIAEAVNAARDLINEPANRLGPEEFTQFALKLFKKSPVKVKVLKQEELEKIGCGALVSVAKGSRRPARMLVLNYRGANSGKKTLGLVGKGITFDSGGLSLKPAKGMAEMKSDMSGAAAVCLATKAIADLKLKINLLTIIPLAENMPDGGAYRPSDVVQALNKKTIEIVSTDAEGRLLLADALSYAVKNGAKYLVDVATLTGGCVVALGDIYSGAVSNNKEFLEKIINAGKFAGEKIWPLPFDSAYKEYLRSDLADLKNCPEDSKASPVVGGIFLSEFVNEIPWVHLDIAGTSFLTREIDYLQKNATGSSVRTLVYLCLNEKFD